jgi:hypothetical protein
MAKATKHSSISLKLELKNARSMAYVSSSSDKEKQAKVFFYNSGDAIKGAYLFPESLRGQAGFFVSVMVARLRSLALRCFAQLSDHLKIETFHLSGLFFKTTTDTVFCLINAGELIVDVKQPQPVDLVKVKFLGVMWHKRRAVEEEDLQYVYVDA